MPIREGFPGQRLIVVPRPQVAAALRSPPTDQLTATDAGYFPQARAHGVRRDRGVRQAIVIVCADGSGWCEINGVRHVVRSGQVLVIPPGEPHAYGADPSNPWTLWWVHVDGPQMPALLARARITATSPLRQSPDPFREVALIDDIVTTLETYPTEAGLFAATGATWQLMILLCASSTAPGGRSTLIEQARRRIKDQPAQSVAVKDLAKIAGMSESHFAALFKKQVGTPVLRYQTELRMSQARLLLDTTEWTVGQIAVEVGYADPFYFSRQFKSIHGVTPLAYRRHDKG